MTLSRRDFIRLLGIGAAGVVAPKLIFDVGKNSHLYTPQTGAGRIDLLDCEDHTLDAIRLTMMQNNSPLVEAMRRRNWMTQYPMIEIKQDGDKLLCIHHPSKGSVGGIYRS